MNKNWFETTWDEVAIGLFIMVINIVAIFKMGSESVPIVTTSVGALGVYLGGKQKTNGENK